MQEQSHGHFHFEAWIPLANKIFKTSLNAPNLFADFAKCDKSADWMDDAVAMSIRLVAMHYTKPGMHAQYIY